MSYDGNTVTAVPITRTQVTAVHLWIIGHSKPGGAGVPQIVYEFRLKMLDLMMTPQSTVPMTDIEMAVMFDWLETFAELPLDLKTFGMALYMAINDAGGDIHEGRPL